MYNTNGVIITDVGAITVAKALETQKSLIFTSVKAGNGDVGDIIEARRLTELVSEYLELEVTSVERKENLVRIRSVFSNAEFDNEKRLKEIGIFVKLEDVDEEILFAYTNYGEGEIIPAGNSNNAVSYTRDLYVGISEDANVTVVLNKTGYVTIEDFENHVRTNATHEADGHMTKADKIRLDAISVYLQVDENIGKSSLGADYCGDFYLG